MYNFTCEPRDNAFPMWPARSFGLATPGVTGRRIEDDFDAIYRPGWSPGSVRQMSLQCYRGRPHGWYTRAPSSAAAQHHLSRRRRRPVITDTATDPSARGKPLLFNQLSRFSVCVAATSSALLSTDSRGEYAAHYSLGGSSPSSRSFFLLSPPSHTSSSSSRLS